MARSVADSIAYGWRQQRPWLGSRNETSASWSRRRGEAHLVTPERASRDDWTKVSLERPQAGDPSLELEASRRLWCR